jgi:phytoene desaturase
MYTVVKGIQSLAESLGVTFHTNAAVEKMEVENGKIQSVTINGKVQYADIILSGADYHHTEKLLDQKYRSYSENYWKKKTFAPSCLLFYVGFDKKIEQVLHHTLFFDAEFDEHARAIYDDPKWPENPLFYASFPSKTDNSCAPEGKEAAIFLIPLAPGLEDIDTAREKYFNLLMARLEKLTGQQLQDSILFVEHYGIRDFVSDYNSYKGNAYGLANTLMQTAIFRPKIKSKKVSNLYFTGQLTVPGPGVPPALISGKIAAEMIEKNLIS